MSNFPTIRARLIVLLAVLSIPFMGYLALSAMRQAEQERADAALHMLSFARLTAAKFDAHVGSVEQMLAVLSHSVGVTRGDTARNNALLRELAATLPAQINTVSVWTVDGANIGALDKSQRLEGINIARRQFFKDVLASTGPGLVFEGPVAAPSNGELVVLLARAIRRGGQAQGVVVASIRLKPLQALLEPGNALPAGVVVTASDMNGVVIARSLEPEKWIGRNLLKHGEGDLVHSLVRGEGVRDGASADGVERIAGFTRTTRAPWLIYVGMPARLAMAPVRARLSESIVLGGAMLLIGLGLAAIVAEGIASPLRRLGEHASAFERGDLSYRSPVDQGGEIGRLASTLNRAADAVLQRTAALQTSEDQLRQITDNMPAMISYLDAGHRFRFANRAHEEWLGIEAQSLIGHTPCRVEGQSGYAAIRQHIESALEGRRLTYERDLETTTGRRRIEVTLVPHFQPDGGVQGLFCLSHDITQRKSSEERLRYLAEFDLLTGLPNRALFMDRLERALARASRSGKPMAVLFVDVDHFKSVNDTYGHEAGDDLLRAFGQMMRSCVRSSDTVARLGGDEFTILLESLSSADDARSVARALVAKARTPLKLGERCVTISTSIGIAMVDHDERDAASVLRRADAALYEAKRLGRDRFACAGRPSTARLPAVKA
jgi:diguanylate cyclase (GGDEF)-like protein/PAS domain S-box-containing protein